MATVHRSGACPGGGRSPKEARHGAERSVPTSRPGGHRPPRGPVPVDHPHGPGGGGRLLAHRRGQLRRRRPAALGGAGLGRLPAGGGLHRAAGPAAAVGPRGRHPRPLPPAGGFAPYAARGLHPAVGFLVGWGYAFVEPLVAPLLFLIFGNVVASTLDQEFGWSYDTWWVVSAVAAAGL